MRKWVERFLGLLDSGALSHNMLKLSEAGAWRCLREFLLLPLLAIFSVVICFVECAALRNLCCLRCFTVVCAVFANIACKIIDDIV